MDKLELEVDVTNDMMMKILDEIAQYSIDIEEDPTQIHLGIPYLQRVLARNRQFSNRVQFYMQKVKRYENSLRKEIRILELDLEFKIKEKLADDSIVRKQPSIEDRKALAAIMLRDEHMKLADLKVQLQDVEENYKIIKSKHQELQRTANDIKTQRNLVKDDMLARLGGHEGYIKPQADQNKLVPAGLPPPVQAPIDPRDILDDSKRPEDMPKPIDAQHAAMISDFMNQYPVRESASKADDVFTDDGWNHVPPLREQKDLAIKPVPNGTKCSVCKEPQMATPSGPMCSNGHGGASPLYEDESEVKTVSYEDLLSS